MVEKDQVVGMSETSLREQLGKAFIELEAHKGAAEDNAQWLEIEEYFSHLELMKKKIEEFEVREKEFKEKNPRLSQCLLTERVLLLLKSKICWIVFRS
ncbi:unnamed protein product [Camellia sinensis]